MRPVHHGVLALHYDMSALINSFAVDGIFKPPVLFFTTTSFQRLIALRFFLKNLGIRATAPLIGVVGASESFRICGKTYAITLLSESDRHRISASDI
jgi:hypothetical protein